jgi:hypothetical protein
VDVFNGAVCMTGYQEVIDRIERNLVVNDGADLITLWTEGGAGPVELRITCQAFPVPPKSAHVPGPLLPLGVDAVAFGEDVLHLKAESLGVRVCLRCARDAVVRIARTPILLSHLRWVDDVLSPVVGLQGLRQYVSLYITEESSVYLLRVREIL